MPSRTAPLPAPFLLFGLIASAGIATLAAAGLARAQEQAVARMAVATPATAAEAPHVQGAHAVHANAEHPGVAQWRRAHAGQAPFDSEHFLAQPPAGTRRALQPAR